MLKGQISSFFRSQRDKTRAVVQFVIVISLLTASVPFFLVDSASAAPFETVTFAQNDSPSDSVWASQTANGPTALTLFADLSPVFSNSGHTFVDWNTLADGTGTSYSNGEMYSFDNATELFAIWSSADQTVTFAENDSLSDSIEATQTEDTTTALTSFSSLSPQFSNLGYTFTGWNSQQNGGGTSYSNGEDYSFSEPMVLWAQWTAPPTITFDDNGGIGGDAPLPDPSGISVSLPSGMGLSFSGYTFAGWNTDESGSGTEYSAGQSLVISSNETLYAQWTPVSPGSGSNSGSSSGSNSGSNSSSNSSSPSSPAPPSNLTSTSTSGVTVNFVANGGSGSLVSINEVTGTNVTLPSSSSVVRLGYTLTSWNTEANGKGASYKPGTSVGMSSSVTLYAQWTSTGSAPVLYGAIGDFAKNSTTLSASLEHEVRDLASVVKAKHYSKVKLYGYTAATGLSTLDRSLSDARASKVASYLRVELRSMKVTGVSVEAAGEGSLDGKTSSLYSRVEVFVSGSKANV
ncbi:MAG TPA: InlB B-repeat-containing protein [Acidimicrobiales bacterium]|jgi:uncharacterized repeat protein (TIGR02543 family)